MVQSAFLAEASAALRAQLESQLRTLKLDAGALLFDQGDHDDRLYLLDEGLLEVSVLSASGKKLSLNRLGPQSVFGEIAVFDPGPRTARVEALEPSSLRTIRHRALVDALAQSPELAEDMLRLAGKRLRWMSRQVEDQVFLTPAARLASKILLLVDDAQEIGMSQAQLADYVGVTREVVSRILSEWRREGLVALSRGRIMVRDMGKLGEIRDADFF